MNRFAVILLIATSSCKASEETASSAQPEKNVVTTGPVINSMLYKAPSKSFEIMFAKISNDTLKTRVTYTGGCSEHSFTLVAPEDRVVDDAPAELRIIHRSNDDYCDSSVVRDLKFDLSKIPLNTKRVTLRGYEGRL